MEGEEERGGRRFSLEKGEKKFGKKSRVAAMVKHIVLTARISRCIANHCCCPTARFLHAKGSLSPLCRKWAGWPSMLCDGHTANKYVRNPREREKFPDPNFAHIDTTTHQPPPSSPLLDDSRGSRCHQLRSLLCRFLQTQKMTPELHYTPHTPEDSSRAP